MNDYEKIIGLIFSFITMAIGIFKIVKRRDLMNNGIKVLGEISSIKKGIRYNKVTFFPVVKFKNFEGEEFKIELKDGTPFPIHAVGNNVGLIYNKDKPEDIIIVSKSSAVVEFVLFIFGCVGILFFYKHFY